MNDIRKKSTGKNILDIPIFRSVWGKAIAGAAALVMFCTVYALILPAAAITGTEATEESGFYLENEENSSEQKSVSVEDIQSDTTDITEAARIAESEASQSEPEDADQTGAGVTAQIAGEEPTDPEATEIIQPETKENTKQSTTETTDSEINENENKDTEKTVKGGAEETAESAEEEKLQPGEASVDPVNSETSEEEPTEASEDEEIKEDDPEEGIAEEEGISEETEEAEVFEDGQLIFEGEDYKVTLDYSADARIPSNSHLDVREILDGDDYDEYLKTAADAVNKKTSEVRARLFDITILAENKDGGTEEIQPQDAVRVSIKYDEAVQIPEDAEMQTVHIPDEGESSTLDTEVETAEDTDTEIEAVAFETESFSVFAVLYTVDFTWEVDGKIFEFGLSGGDSVSLRELAEALHVYEPDEAKNGEEEHDFSESIEKAEFSDRELVWVGKIDHDSTAKQIAKENGLEIEYSDELTDEQIEELQAKEYAAGEWVLLSVKPFRTEETLTVTMDTEEVFTIKVTDSQIIKNIFTSKGESFKITVTFSEDEVIPEGTDIDVREILEGTDEYGRYMSESAAELNADTADISFARFFDIKFVDQNGEKFEPQDPADVKIEYKDSIDTREGTLTIVHFAEDGVEKIDPALDESAAAITFTQDSFSITATIVSGGSLPQPDPRNGTKYAIVIEHPETHKYYAVENDGSLVEVEYDNGKVTLDYPLEWTYISAHDGLPDTATGGDPSNPYGYDTNNGVHPEWDPYNLRFVADCRRYDSGTQLPLGAYFRYISPVSESGLDEETENSWHHGSPNGWNSLDGHKWTNGLRYQNQRIYDIHWDDNVHTNVSNGFYIGADWDSMHIIGRQPAENAAIVHMAVISETDIPVPTSNNETVTHIDISIAGNGVLDVPLAYGTYYYKDGQGNLHEAYTIDSGGDRTLHLEQNVPIDQKDIMKARIYAFDHNGNEVPNAYNITGYTSNQTSPYSPVQVRVEGSFKVTTLDPYVPRWWEPGRSNDNSDRRADRLNPENQITYQVVVNKDVDFQLIDPDYGQLYDMHGNELTVPVKMALTDGFAYWDSRNECPPLEESFEEDYYDVLFRGEDLNEIRGRNHRNWQAGAIIDNDWGGNPSYKGDSGMDFVLGNDAKSNPNILAVEVIKIIEDENGNRINPGSTVTNSFTLCYNSSKDQAYAGAAHSVHDLSVNTDPPITSNDLSSGGYYSGYDDLRSFSIDVNTDSSQSMNRGMGVYYDYRVKDGMYYVREDGSPMEGQNKTITDVDGKKWTYKETEVKTEYVWRNNQYNGMKHTADGYSAVPEVLGSYTTDEPYEAEDDEGHSIITSDASNGFLEFYVYNIYEAKKYPVYIKKVDSISGAGGIAGAEFDVYGPYTSEETSAEGFDPKQEEKKINTESIVSTDTNIKIGDFSDGIYYLYETKAPEYYKPFTDPIIITVDSTKEDSQAVTYTQGESKTGVYVTQDGEGQPQDEPYYELAVENEPIDLEVLKQWEDGQALHSAKTVTFRIERIPYDKENDYTPEDIYTGALNTGNNWRDLITGLPRTGTYTPEGGEPITVSYRYFVIEDAVEGYSSVTHGALSQDGNKFTVTIVNTPFSFEKPTEVVIEKDWLDAQGQPDSGHDKDQITVQITQRKYELNIHPITIKLQNADPSDEPPSPRTIYVTNGNRLQITPHTYTIPIILNPYVDATEGFDNLGQHRTGNPFYIRAVTEGKSVKMELRRYGIFYPVWGSAADYGVWAYTIDTPYYEEAQLLSLTGNPVSTETFGYTMALSQDGNDTVMLPVGEAQGVPSGSGVWSGTISDLPYLMEETGTHKFYIYTYEVSEVKIGGDDVVTTSPPAGFNGQTGKYLVKWVKNQDGSWSITNQRKPSIEVTVLKVDMANVATATEESTDTLPGAIFVLEKYTNNTYQEKDTRWHEQTISDTAGTGKFVFDELYEGYYQLVETKCPTGYINDWGNPRFRIDDEMNVILVDAEGHDLAGNISDEVKVLNRTVIVGNEPGAALPNAGGPGTKLFTILGLVMMLGAGVILFRRRLGYL